MESIQATLAAQAADTIVGFLYAAHQQDRAIQRSIPLRFEDQEDFNEYIDTSHGAIEILELSFRPSEVLFHVDHQAYRDALSSFRSDEADEGGEAGLAASSPTGAS